MVLNVSLFEPPARVLGRVVAVSLVLLTACGGGGRGGGTGSGGRGDLVAITFPDPHRVNEESREEPPRQSPLNQQLRFHFSDPPDPSQVSAEALSIRDGFGVLVAGQYEVKGRAVTFTPQLPLRPTVEVSPEVYDVGGAALLPARTYLVRVGQSTWPGFLRGVSADLAARFPDPVDPNGVQFEFSTTSDPANFWRGLPDRTPELVAVKPRDGAVDVSPQLYGDPDQLFPERSPFVLEFDGPIDPTEDNLGRILLVDLDERGAAHPAGLSLGVNWHVVQNEVNGSVVEIAPSGLLPFGHLLSLEAPRAFLALGQPLLEGDLEVVSTFAVSPAPAGRITDRIAEDFDDATNRDPALRLIPRGTTAAEWDVGDSNYLEPGFAFQGAGELGRFLPPAPGDPNKPRTVLLDTERQEFPLLDGSTPDAPHGTIITGGVFSFTEIDIPHGIILEANGPYPLVLTSTGTVRIAGDVLLPGKNGISENSFDSSVTSIPGGKGGVGGGRGGESQPIFFNGPAHLLNLVSPSEAGRGWGPSNLHRIGGQGGQCGNMDNPDPQGLYGTDAESNCGEALGHSNQNKPPGGGGGSYFKEGRRPAQDGIGNVLADSRGGYIVRTPETHGADHDVLRGGDPGVKVFFDERIGNDFIGSRGELEAIQGGQGGGGGASKLDSYFCGDWCRRDGVPGNEALCLAEFGTPRKFADSVGDSRGGSGGGGGGALQIQALGSIVVTSTSTIDCSGGTGGSGEQVTCGNWGGAGGGGSGGAIILQSATGIDIRANAFLDTLHGRGGGAVPVTTHFGGSGSCPFRNSENRGGGGHGGNGLVQLQVPLGQTAQVHPDATVRPWLDQSNTQNPVEFTALSMAHSKWIDLGRVIERAPAGVNPEFRFRGLDAGGMVVHENGHIPDPENVDVRVDFLGLPDPDAPGGYLPGQEPRANYIPENTSIQIEFQGASAIAPGSKEVDPDELTDWAPTAEIADGKQFIRYRITFNLALDGEIRAAPPRPVVQELNLWAEF